jgi:serpin B
MIVNHPRLSLDLRDAIQLAGTLNTFGIRVHHQLPKSGNCFFSPISIATALAALVPAARGDTRNELEAVLGLRGLGEAIPDRFSALLQTLLRKQGTNNQWASQDGRLVERASDLFVLRAASGLFVQSGFSVRTEYEQTLEEAFHVDLLALDFGRPEEAASRINQWVSDRTDERINQIVFREHIDALTRLILANAVYFLASWRHQFQEDETRLERFHRGSGSVGDAIDVPMMHMVVGLPYLRDRQRGFEAVIIPYRAMSMMVILPDSGQLAQVDDALSAELVEDVAERAVNRSIALGLPRFQLESSCALRGALERGGVRRALDPNRADFSGISDDAGELAVTEVLHRARIRVDEYGTEAVAATVVALTTGAVPLTATPHPFIVNRPFILFIRDDVTHTILFAGRITDPLA